MLIEVGNIVDGKVSGITAFGAFIQLPEGKTGLVHISEIAGGYVKNVKDFLQDDQEVKVKILSIDDNGKISLSIKKAVENREARPGRSFSKPDNLDWSKKKPESGLTFEDKLSKFKVDSDERMKDIKRNMESKRGGGYKRSINA